MAMIRLILLQLIIFAFINAEYIPLYYNNKTYENPPDYGKINFYYKIYIYIIYFFLFFIISTARFKRTLLYNRYPKILGALIKNELGEYIHLELVQTNQYLANENLPVWKATEYYEKLDTN